MGKEEDKKKKKKQKDKKEKPTKKPPMDLSGSALLAFNKQKDGSNNK